MNRQILKRTSVVYFLALIVTAVMLMTAIAETLTGGGEEYTSDADFDKGVLVGVEYETVHDQLQLSEENVTLPFIWVPNMQGTVSKLNTETGDELGRYWVVPPGLPVENGSPSRTTVDLEGNCWVGNRCAGTVVKIGLYEAGNWIDRNADGICQTSQDTNADGDITGDELLPWGEDECVLYEVVLIPGREGTYVPGTFVGTGPEPIGPGWLHRDIGNPLPGDAEYVDGTWTITADGYDIWENSDDFHYVFQSVAGDCEIIARVVSIGLEPVTAPRIIFVSDRSGNKDIWIMNTDGSNLEQLTTNIGLDEQPVPSPDGQRIAYISDSGNPSPMPGEAPNTDIWVMNTDGTEKTRLTSFASYYCYQPAWSPDGGQIVFVRENGGVWLCQVPSDASAVPTILESGVARYNPEFSPDGSRLIYGRDTGGGWWDLYQRTMPYGPEYLLATAYHSVAGAYSHSGDRIAYIQAWRPICQVRMMNADGSNNHLLFDDSSDVPGTQAFDGWGQLAWAPGDTRVAASIYNSLYPGVPEFDDFIQILDPDTKTEIYRTTLGRNMFAYECTLYGQRRFVAGNKVWSPDGSRLAFMANRDGNWEVYVMDADGGNQTNLSQNSAWDGDSVWCPSLVAPATLHQWAKASVMIRETLGSSSTHAHQCISGAGFESFQWRQNSGGSSAHASTTEVVPLVPHWIKVVRSGDEFSGYYSPDGVSWTQQGNTVTIPMSDGVYIGLAHTSHRANSMSTAVFDNVTVNATGTLNAHNPNPADGTVGVFTDAKLGWLPGDGATLHDVYFGTNPVLGSSEFQGSQAGTTFDPGPLLPGTTYYWQIVEQSSNFAGPVWSFKTFREGTGTILREVWQDIIGVSIPDLTSDLSYPDNPSFSDELLSFEAPIDWGSNYGTRIHGYLHPETSGNYTFWIASDDAGELWLSIDDNPANAVLIANVPGWCESRDWYNTTGTANPNQQSTSILLTGGNKYYIMALYKEGTGGDNLAVAWQGSDQPQAPVIGSDNAIIADYYLSPYASSGAPAPDVYDISLYDTGKWSTSPRGLAIDASNNLWAGTYLSSNYHYIDGSTGTILKTVDVSAWNHHAYGAVIDKNGILWSAGHDPANLLRMDPRVEPPTISMVPIDHEHVYGLGLDYLDHLFVSAWNFYKLSRVDISTTTIDWTKYPKYELFEARGVACTSDNNVWVATTAPGYVYRYDNEGNPLTPGIYVGSPTGVAVDAEGKVWACNLNDETIVRIDPDTDTVTLTKSIIGSGGHYSYSDMTGIMARTITTRIGTWTVIYDAGEDVPWGTVLWSSLEPDGTSVTVKVRSKSDQTTWSAWETAENGIDLQETPCGRYLQVETTLQILSGEVSPVLYDLAVLPSYAAVTYDGDTLISTGGEPTATAVLTATLRDEEGLVFDIDGIEVTFTLSAEGRDDIVLLAQSVGGIAVVESPPPLEPDIYSIEVAVECASTSALLAIYNPEGGFATGGGWIVPEDDGLNTYSNQRANFGFNAKYKQDAATGHIEFRYSDGYIDLKSSSIEQLVITGGKIAMFKGWASVNREPDHWFFVKAIDNGEPGINDTFDIKVWAPGVDTEGDPTERAGGTLQGGNIVVHTR